MNFRNPKIKGRWWLWLGLLFVLGEGMTRIARAESNGTLNFNTFEPCGGEQSFNWFQTAPGEGITACSNESANHCVGGTVKEYCSGVTEYTISTSKGNYDGIPVNDSRFGMRFDTFQLSRDLLNRFKLLTANSSLGCTSSNCCASSEETISWILLRGKAPHPNGSLPGDVSLTTTPVAGVFTYNKDNVVVPSETYKLSGDKRYSLVNTTVNSSVYKARGRLSSGDEHSCISSLWRADFSVSGDNATADRPFGNLVAIQFGKNLRIMRTIANADPIVAVGVPNLPSLTEGGMSGKNLNVFGGLYTNYGSDSSLYQTQMNVFLVPDSLGTTFTIKKVESPGSPLTATDIGTLTCTNLNSPAQGFCSGKLTITAVGTSEEDKGNAYCMVAYGIGDMAKDTLFCVAQEPTNNSRHLKTLTTIIAGTTHKAIVTVSPPAAMCVAAGTSTAEKCWTITNATPRSVPTLSATNDIAGVFSPLQWGSGGAIFTQSSGKSNLCGSRLAAFESCVVCSTATLEGDGFVSSSFNLSAATAPSTNTTLEGLAAVGRNIASLQFEAFRVNAGQKPRLRAITGSNAIQNIDNLEEFITASGVGSTGTGSVSASLEGDSCSAVTPASDEAIEVVAPETAIEKLCMDGGDNDGDGDIDCADSDCESTLQCWNSCEATYANAGVCMNKGYCRRLAGCSCGSGSILLNEHCNDLSCGFPTAPVRLRGTAGNGQVTLTWLAPFNNKGCEITDYEIEYSSNSGSTWTTFSDGTSTSTTATVTGLTNGTAYVFRVLPINSAGNGEYSSNSASVTPVAP